MDGRVGEEFGKIDDIVSTKSPPRTLLGRVTVVVVCGSLSLSLDRTYKHCVEVSEDEGRGGGEGEGEGESRPIHREGAEATEEWRTDERTRTHARTGARAHEL